MSCGEKIAFLVFKSVIFLPAHANLWPLTALHPNRARTCMSQLANWQSLSRLHLWVRWCWGVFHNAVESETKTKQQQQQQSCELREVVDKTNRLHHLSRDDNGCHGGQTTATCSLSAHNPTKTGRQSVTSRNTHPIPLDSPQPPHTPHKLSHSNQTNMPTFQNKRLPSPDDITTNNHPTPTAAHYQWP